MLRRWRIFNRGGSESSTLADQSTTAETSGANAAIQVSIRDLVAMRRYANQVDLARLIRSRANRVGVAQSRYRGRGMDYQESRAYQAGDDIRNMDWRVTARAGKPHVKVYDEERERPVFFLVDFRAPMFFASRGVLKSVQAARATALLSWAASDRGDRVGALVMSDRDKELKPESGARGVLAILRQLVTHSDPHAGLNRRDDDGRFEAALTRLLHIVRPGSLVFMVSDFHGFNEAVAAKIGRLCQHADVVALRPIDVLERTAPPADRYAVSDGESVRTLSIGGARDAKVYREYFQTQEAEVNAGLDRLGIVKIDIETNEDIIRKLGARAKTGANRKSEGHGTEDERAGETRAGRRRTGAVG